MLGLLRLLTVVGLVCSLALWAAGAEAAEPIDDSTKNAARELAQRAKEAIDRGDYEAARDLYGRAYALVPAPTLSLREARALVELGLLVEAAEAYVRTTRTVLTEDSTPPFRRAVEQAQRELAKLKPRIPELKLVLKGAAPEDVSVTMDGQPYSVALLGVERPVNPGSHQIVAQRDGDTKVEATVDLAEGATEQVELVIGGSQKPAARAEPADAHMTAASVLQPPEEDSVLHSPPVTYAALGVGALGLGIGVVTGIIATKKHSELEAQCPDNQCVEGSPAEGDLKSFRLLRTVSTVSYVVGALGVAGGVTLLLLAPERRSRQAGVTPYVTPTGAGLSGRF